MTSKIHCVIIFGLSMAVLEGCHRSPYYTHYEKQLDENIFQVFVKPTAPLLEQEMSLFFRSAQLTLEKGYDHFELVELKRAFLGYGGYKSGVSQEFHLSAVIKVFNGKQTNDYSAFFNANEVIEHLRRQDEVLQQVPLTIP